MIHGVFQQAWPGVSLTAILNEEKALGTRLEGDSARRPRRIFPPSSPGDVNLITRQGRLGTRLPLEKECYLPEGINITCIIESTKTTAC